MTPTLFYDLIYDLPHGERLDPVQNITFEWNGWLTNQMKNYR